LDEEIKDDRSTRKKDHGQLSKWKNPPLDEEIKDGISTRKKDRGQLSKWKNPPLDALEHCTRERKDRLAKPRKCGSS
jgi:hypothetical protein